MKPVRFILTVPRDPANALPIMAELESQPAPRCSKHTIFSTDRDVPVIKIGNRGYLVGIVFLRGSDARLLSLPDDAPVYGDNDALAKWLVRECWGGYVAILGCADGTTIDVITDPSGLCPIYKAETATHILVATHPALFASTGGAKISVSYPALHSFLARPALRQRSTCLAGVTEFSPGEMVAINGPRHKSRQYWQPESFMPDSMKITFDEAAENLAHVSQTVCSAWAKVFGPLVVAASGGVDSSLICAALAGADMPFGCATVSTSDPSGDERRFVELLASHLGVGANASVYDARAIDPLRTVSGGLARPSRKSFMAALEAALFAAGTQVGAEVVFDGNGGDNLFCFLHSSAPVVDRLRCEGLGRGVLSTFFDMCRVTGCDIPTMAKAVGRRWVRRDTAFAWPPDMRLLCQESDFSDTMEPLSPWLHTAVGPHGGKRDHLALIMRAQLHIHGLSASGLPRFSPLASQPLLEYCLSVPTWLWCQGGTNRALARAAFGAKLPREIVKRTSKAGPDSFIQGNFETHRESIRDLLMEGLLAQHRVIDRAAVDNAFRGNFRSEGEILLRLLDLAEAENWARSWLS